MTKNLEITILAENSVEKRGFLAEHGLSFYINYGKEKYLFDTGQGLVLSHNAKKLDINLEQISSVILSHGHDDHTGGLDKLLKINSEVEIIAHREAFSSKFKKADGKLEFIGNNTDRENIKKFTNAEKKTEINKGMYVTGEVPVAKNKYINEKYISGKRKNKVVDNFKDDISLYFDTPEGIIVLLGCSHKGVVNILEYVKELTNGKRIKAIIGGMHLKHSSDKKVTKIIDYFSRLNFDLLVPIHCTGTRAAMMMKDRFKSKVKIASVGESFIFS